MIVRYRQIYLGRVIGQQKAEYDGGYTANAERMEQDIYDGVDPLHLAHTGREAYWNEALVLPEPRE